jgi:myosin heavy subunit
MANHTDPLWWIPDDADVWTLALQKSGTLPNGCINFTVKKNNKTVTLAADKCLPTVSNLDFPEDLVMLHEINQATILSCTRSRFEKHKIYTSIGDVLMSVNPFEVIRGLYGKEIVQRYRNPADKKGLPAHVYSIPSQAYADMKLNERDQSILISGESGAGKYCR